MNQWRSGLREDWPKWPSGYALLRLPNTCASRGTPMASAHDLFSLFVLMIFRCFSFSKDRTSAIPSQRT